MANLIERLKKKAIKSSANKKKSSTKKKTGVVLDLNKTAKKAKEKQNTNVKTKTTQKKSGLVLSEKKGQRQEETKKAKANWQDTVNSLKQTTKKEAAKKAIQKRKTKTALGTTVKTHKEKYDTRLGSAREVRKLGTATAIVGEGVKQVTAEKKKLKKQGYSNEQIKDFGKEANKQIKSTVKKENKKIDKEMPKEIDYSYKDLTQQEYNQLATASQSGQLNNLLKSNKDLAKKVADLNVKDYVKGAFSMGALDQLTQGLSVSENPVYDYSKSQKQIMERQKETKAYNAGRMAGAVGEFALGGTDALGSAMFKTAGKTALKEAAKSGGKNLAKTTAKNIGKEVAGDTVASLELNALDALKFSYEDGKFDKKTFGKELALNVAGDILIGGAVSGLTHGLSAKQVSNFNRINNTLKKGGKVSDAELKFYNKHVEELADKIKTATMKKADVESPKLNYKERELYAELSNKKNAGAKLTEQEQNAFDRLSAKATAKQDIDFAKQVDKVLFSKGPNRDNLIVGKTPEKLQEYGIANANMTMRPSAVPKIAYPAGYDDALKGLSKKKSHGHNLGVGAVKKIREELEQPVAIFKSDTQPNSFVVFTKRLDENNNPVMVAIHLNKNGEISTGNKIASMYGKSEFETFIKQQKEKGNLLYEDTKIGLENLPTVGLQLPKAGDLLDPINTIYKNIKNVNAKEQQLQKANGETFEEAAVKAVENPGKQYDSIGNAIKAENPTPKEIHKMADSEVSADEIATTARKVDEMYLSDSELHEFYAENEARGMFDRISGMSQAEARTLAKKEFDEKGVERMAEDFVNNDLPLDGHVAMAKAEILLEQLKKAHDSGVDNKVLYMKVLEKTAVEFASVSGRNLNAVKMLYKATPLGRVRVARKQIEALAKEYKSRLKGKELKLTDEQEARIYNASTEEEIASVMQDVTLEVWRKIPSSLMEQLNMMRRISMLFNVKTNLRNLSGNMVFRGARSISDGVEYILTSKVFKSTLENKKIESAMSSRATFEELSNAKSYIYNDVFPENYKNANSTGRYIEKRRPDGVTVLKPYVLSKLETTNFKVLEVGDVYPAFRPAYLKSYLRWCKNNKIDVKDIDALKNMTEKQKATANAYAMKEAEKATFRDVCAVSDKLIALKNKTETAQGKTVFGTMGYRVANMSMEAVLPFVKTPVNVFRRSIDYSPISLLRALGDFATYAKRNDTEAILNGIHHLSTGLTGTGITLLGMLLASSDIVTVKAGEVSGDAFYDRDMGYQDYSLVIGGKSITIDWMSPMQTSFFMGAQAYKKWQERDDLNGVDYFEAALTLFEPHLESSFMSSAKDTLELFMDTANGDGTESSKCWGEAILATLGGTLPQNYLNSFLSAQLVNQSAQAFDKYQRDTRSTSDNALKKSWQSWGRKVINRYPGLRNELLNPKINRKGEHVKTEGENIVTRMLNAFVNPSNVKTINLTNTDKEVIDIYRNMPSETKADKEAKRWFYYNLTGQSFDRGDGERMSYDEAYKHGKTTRASQWKNIQDMISSKRYSNMANSMKVSEMKSYNILSTTKADRKVFGDSFAVDNIINQFGSKADVQVAQNYRLLESKSDADFLNFYLKKEYLIARSHDADNYTKAVACYKYGDWDTAKQYNISKEQWKRAKNYFKNDNGSVTQYITGMCNAISSLTKENATVSQRNKAVASADYETDVETLRAMGLSDAKINMGYGLNKVYEYSYKALSEHVANAEYNYDSDDSGSLSKEEIVDYIDSLGLETDEEKACLFQYIYNEDTDYNPYGAIPNYRNINGYSGQGSGGKGKSKKKSDLPSWEDYVKDYMNSIEEMSGIKFEPEAVKFKDWNSPLNQAYRNKINSINKKREA